MSICSKVGLWLDDAILWQRCQAFDHRAQAEARDRGDLKTAKRYQAYSRDDFILFQDAMERAKVSL